MNVVTPVWRWHMSGSPFVNELPISPYQLPLNMDHVFVVDDHEFCAYWSEDHGCFVGNAYDYYDLHFHLGNNECEGCHYHESEQNEFNGIDVIDVSRRRFYFCALGDGDGELTSDDPNDDDDGVDSDYDDEYSEYSDDDSNYWDMYQ